MSESNFFSQNPDDLPDEVKDFIQREHQKRIDRGEDPNAPIHLTPQDVPPEIKAALDKVVGQELAHRALRGEFADTVSDQLAPSADSLNLQPGDRAMLIRGLSGAAGVLTLVQLVDPAEHAETFPDWEERSWRSYVLCKYWTALEHGEDPDLGWFSRLSLMRIPEEYQWEYFFKEMLDEDVEEDPPPAWKIQLFVDHIHGVSAANDNFIPAAASCVACGSTALLLEASRTQENRFFIGHQSDDPDPSHYYAFMRYKSRERRLATALCLSCGHTDDLTDRRADVFVAKNVVDF